MGNTNNGTHFSKHYKTGKAIGSGTFAVVKKCTRKRDSKAFAVKIIHKNRLTNKELQNLKDEIKILTAMKSHNHPNICHIEEVFEDERKVKMVLELCKDQTLLDSIYSAPNRRLDESKVAHIIHTITKSLQYLHDNHVVHRDLKPENILFAKDGTIKIADFGSAHKHKLSSTSTQPRTAGHGSTPGDIPWNMKTNIGTPLYVAPEVLKDGKYSHMVDLWSVGVILYVCLCGYHPFNARKSVDLMYKNIMAGNYKFSPSLWENIDEDAIDLIKSLLRVEPNQRMTCGELLKHKWILKHVKH